MLAVLRSVEQAFPTIFPSHAPPHLRINALHSDIVYLVARHLVCKRLSELLRSDRLWSPLIATEFPVARVQHETLGSWKEVYLTWFRGIIKSWRLSGLTEWPKAEDPATLSRNPMKDTPIKVVMFGPAASGKTSLMNRIAKNEFSTPYIPTIGVDFAHFYWQSNKVQLWDLSGDPRFKNIVKHYYRGGHVGMFVYNDATTRDLATEWLEGWFSDTGVTSHPRPLIFVRTRCDVPNTTLQVDKDFLLEFAARRSVLCPLFFMDVSSATGSGFDKLANVIVNCGGGEQCMTVKYIVPEAEVRARMPLLDAPWYKRIAYWY